MLIKWILISINGWHAAHSAKGRNMHLVNAPKVIELSKGIKTAIIALKWHKIPQNALITSEHTNVNAEIT